MPELKIESFTKHEDPQHGQVAESQVDPKEIYIRLKEDNKIVAETTLEVLVYKFLMLSAEHAKLLHALGMIDVKQESKIVMEQDGTDAK